MRWTGCNFDRPVQGEIMCGVPSVRSTSHWQIDQEARGRYRGILAPRPETQQTRADWHRSRDPYPPLASCGSRKQPGQVVSCSAERSHCIETTRAPQGGTRCCCGMPSIGCTRTSTEYSVHTPYRLKTHGRHGAQIVLYFPTNVLSHAGPRLKEVFWY